MKTYKSTFIGLTDICEQELYDKLITYSIALILSVVGECFFFISGQ